MMYYRVLRKLIRYILAMCLIIGGFSCGLIVIAWSNGKNGFQYPFKSFVVTLTMAMGEFETSDRYEEFFQDEEEEIGRTFALILIILMIFSCTITMINLFIAAIIDDKNELEETVFRENLFYMARSSEVIKDIFKTLKKRFHLSLPWFNEKFNVKQSKEFFCLHQVCGKTCWGDQNKRKLPSYIRHKLPKLKEIAQKNIARQKIKEKQSQIDSEKAGTNPHKEQNLVELNNHMLLLRSQLSSFDIESIGSRPGSVVDKGPVLPPNETFSY